MTAVFLEIGCEEIPARLQAKAISDLQQLLIQALQARGFSPAAARSAISPRHMAIEVSGLEEQLAARITEKRGPRTDAPDRAIEGFCQSLGLTRDKLIQQDTEKGRFYFASCTEDGAVLAECLPALVCGLLADFPWPKSQRWARSRLSWVRPLRAVNVLVDGRPLAGRLDLGGGMAIVFGNSTQGHPFHAPGQITLKDFDSYIADMKAAFVLVDHAERKSVIRAQLDQVAADRGLQPVTDEGLLDEITGLVEWPHVITGEIETDFMALPAEILVTSMKVHQKFFALSPDGAPGNLAPFFMTVANRRADKEKDRLIASGNERVLKARLSDARFFWEQDRARPLGDCLDALSAVTFYEGLGSLGAKAQRMQTLSAMIAEELGGCDPALAGRAGLLAKTDLVSGMVGEFPELQGIMGGYYTEHAGEGTELAAAVSEHYRPQGPSDTVPQSVIGICVSLADKTDTLTGFFAIGQKPTGSRDPFALRRAALGIIRMIDEADLTLDLGRLFDAAARLHGHDRADDELQGFIFDRLRVRLRDKGLGHDVVAAALAAPQLATAVDVRLACRLASALDSFLQTRAGHDLVAGWRRVASILEAEEKKGVLGTDVDASLFEAGAEKQLYRAVQELTDSPADTPSTAEAAMRSLSGLSAPINLFFDEVIVNSDNADVRANRLALLSQIRMKMMQIADFGQLEG